MQRVPAAWIAKRMGGWNFPFTPFSQAKSLAIPVMTTNPLRPDGHTGIYMRDVYEGKITQMLHAGGGGVVAVIVESKTTNYYFPKTRVILQVRWD